MNKKNILLYIDSLMVGGMHKQTFYLAKYLNRNIFNVIVLTQNSNKGGLSEDFNSTGCELLDLGRNSLPSNKKPFNPLIAFKLLRILKQKKIDIIYLNAAPNLFYFQLAKLFLFKRIVQIGSFRALYFWKGNLGWRYKLFDNIFAQILYITSKHTIVNSEYLYEHYNKKLIISKKHPLHVINNGCDFHFNLSKSICEIRNELKLNQKQYFVLMAARLDPWKDFQTLLQTAAIVKVKDNSIKFFVMGDGPLKNEISNNILFSDLSDTIFLIGEKVDSINYINACDISILSTNGEGFSNVILESMFLKKTVIATKVGGNISLIGDTNQFGFLVEPKNPDDLAEKILFCKNNIQITYLIGCKAHERIMKICDISRYIESYENIFK